MEQTTPAPVIESGRYDTADYADELARAPRNHEVGTALWFANDHVRVFEIRLEPGERGPFHIHDKTYFWTVVEPGRGRQRLTDGTFSVRDYRLGETKYLVHSAEDSLIHDLENAGTTTLRFVTVELLDGTAPSRP
ncbi:MAG: cupin domain-containing protein [Acidimicrobiales bacterium]